MCIVHSTCTVVMSSISLSLSLSFSLLSAGNLDMVVVGAGTGGTVCGIGRKMKDKLPNVKVHTGRAASVTSVFTKYREANLEFSPICSVWEG